MGGGVDRGRVNGRREDERQGEHMCLQVMWKE